MPPGHEMQTISTIVKGIAQGIEPFLGSNQPQYTTVNDNHQGIEPAPNSGQTNQNEQMGNDQTDNPYGIFEPIVHHTSLDDCSGTVQHGEGADHEPDEEARIFTAKDDDFIREEQFVNFAPHEDDATDLPPSHNSMQETRCNDAHHEDHATDLPEEDNEDNLDEDFGDNEENAPQSRKFVSAREYYCFKLQGLFDTVVAGESRGDRIGKRIVLPRTFPGGDRDMQRREACEHLGLIEHDKTLDDCMMEAATFQMPCALRRLFATILVFCEATEIRKMWDKHLASMSDDYHLAQSNETAIEQMVLRDIRDMLQSMGKDITSYGLPDLVKTDGSYGTEYREVTEERQVTVDREHLDLFGRLNGEQLAGFNDIMDHVTNKKGQIFFVDGPGGTGKTYLYKPLLAKVRSMGLIAIATATSGIAASIMPGGRTAHSRFKIPIKLKDNSMCSFTKQSGTAELLKHVSLIIWDEVAMTKRQAVETLDRSLQDIMECPLPFGGKVVVFGGDFRQVLPVVTRGTRAQITDATVLRSYLWEKTRKIRLTRNMRAQADPWFSEYLLRIGNGTEETIGDDYVRLPDDIVIGYTEDEKAINRLIGDVFPALNANARSREYMSERAILSTKNEHVDDLNDKMISRFPGEERLYHSFDSIEDDLQNNYTIDFLNSITPNGLPPHVLKLKVNCPVILLRNLDPHNGLCNGLPG
ncbi:hypothetical protein ACQ4PT_021133 [Festuca glaucescens]